MCKCIKATWRWACEYWERVLFALVGLACLGLSFRYLYYDNITSASATFAVAFFSFIYANLSRFKKFKGLGFEAELWADKQKEAVDLIERMKGLVTIYTRQIVMSSVNRMRLGSAGWRENWTLYDALVNQHDALGQKIDFTELKNEVDAIFIWDICSPLCSPLRAAIENAKTEAKNEIAKKFGNPIGDVAGFGQKVQELRDISLDTEGMFERAINENIAQEVLNKAKTASAVLKQNFSIEAKFDPAVIQMLEKVAALHKMRPLKITEELLRLQKDADEARYKF